MNRRLFLLALVAIAPAARADLIGLSSNYDFGGNTPGYLWNVDPSSAAATQANAVTQGGGYVPTSIVGLAYLNGTLYSTDTFGNGGDFGSIDPATGVFTPIGNQNGSINWWTLAADPTAGALYTIEGDGGNDPANTNYGSLYLVSPTDGSVTNLGKTNENGNDLFMNSIAYDTATGDMYGWSGSNLYSISTVDASLTFVGNSGGQNFDNGGDMTYDAGSDTLYAIENNALYTIDPTTGAATFVGNTGSSQRIDGLAGTPFPAAVPEPASLVGLGLGALAFSRRRRRA